MDFSFYNPVAISILSPGTWKDRINKILTKPGNVLFLYYGSISKSNPEFAFFNSLKTNPKVTLLSGIMSNPSIDFLAELRTLLTSNYATIIAMGGGSTIDIGKALIALGKYDNRLSSQMLLKIIEQNDYKKMDTPRVKLIAIPTTAGTGSELTRWATVWDSVNKRKYSIEKKDLYPSEAWIDSALTATMSSKVTASTGLDALSHAMEAYWSTNTNPIVRRLSAQAITLVIENLHKAILSHSDLNARVGMCLGSVYAGLAFSQTRTAAAHALSYPLTIKLGIPHGIAVALWLIPVMQLNWDTIQEKNIFLSSFGCVSLENVEACIKKVVEGVVSLDFKDYNISVNDLDELYNDTEFMQARLGNNPVKISLDELKKLLTS